MTDHDGCWQTITPPDGPWVLVVPSTLLDAKDPAESLKIIFDHFQSNPPLILAANDIDEIAAFDEAEMARHGWVRA